MLVEKLMQNIALSIFGRRFITVIKVEIYQEIEAMIEAAIEQIHTGGNRNWMILAEFGADSYPTFSHELFKKD